MAEFKGYIYLHRKLLDHWIWTSNERFDKRSAFIDLLLLANHADKEILIDSIPMTIKRSQLLTSQRKLAARWHWTDKSVKRYLDSLKKSEIIYFDVTKRYTLITILKYAEYQDYNAFMSALSTQQSTALCPHSVPHSGRTPYGQTINVINDNKLRINENKGAEPPVEEFKRWGS